MIDDCTAGSGIECSNLVVSTQFQKSRAEAHLPPELIREITRFLAVASVEEDGDNAGTVTANSILSSFVHWRLSVQRQNSQAMARKGLEDLKSTMINAVSSLETVLSVQCGTAQQFNQAAQSINLQLQSKLKNCVHQGENRLQQSPSKGSKRSHLKREHGKTESFYTWNRPSNNDFGKKVCIVNGLNCFSRPGNLGESELVKPFIDHYRTVHPKNEHAISIVNQFSNTGGPLRKRRNSTTDFCDKAPIANPTESQGNLSFSGQHVSNVQINPEQQESITQHSMLQQSHITYMYDEGEGDGGHKI